MESSTFLDVKQGLKPHEEHLREERSSVISLFLCNSWLSIANKSAQTRTDEVLVQQGTGRASTREKG